MSEFRFNRVTGDWVIIASEHARRPEDYIIRGSRRDPPPHVPTCPFCVGNEGMTDTIFAEPPDTNWAVRVIKNKLPALDPQHGADISGNEMARRMPGFGFHEMLIEHPDHNRYLFDQSTEELTRVLAALRRRYSEMGSDERISLVVIFKNHGAGA